MLQQDLAISNQTALVDVFKLQIAATLVAWDSCLSQGGQVLAFKQLRIKLRSVRSLLAFFKPLLGSLEVEHYQAQLRQQGKMPEQLRALDELYLSIECRDALGGKVSTKLKDRVRQERQDEWQNLHLTVSLPVVCAVLTQLAAWLETRIAQLKGREGDVLSYEQSRLGQWSYELRQHMSTSKTNLDMEHLHRLRIKVKRLRYVLLALPHLSANGELLSTLKEAQDILGVLHDDYVNVALAQGMKSTDTALKSEIASFISWEEERIQEGFAKLPLLWQKLEKVLP